MHKNKWQTILANDSKKLIVIALYTAPFLVWVSLPQIWSIYPQNFLLFGIGLLMILAGTVSMLLVLHGISMASLEENEKAKPPSVDPILISEIESLRQSFQLKNEELLKLKEEHESLKTKHVIILKGSNDLKNELELKASQQHEEKIQELRIANQNLETRVFELENEIEDLKYEMRAILNLNHPEEEIPLPEAEILADIKTK